MTFLPYKAIIAQPEMSVLCLGNLT